MQPILKQAITAIKSGDKQTGGKLLAELILTDQENEQAWLWMSCIVEHDDRRRECLTRLLAINPLNLYAQQELTRMQSSPPPDLATLVTYQSPVTPASAAQPAWNDVNVRRLKVVKHLNSAQQTMVDASLSSSLSERTVSRGIGTIIALILG